MADSKNLLHKYNASEKYGERQRANAAYNPMYSYRLPRGDSKQYAQQFGDMYFLRLAKLKPVLEAMGQEEWEDFEIAGEKAQKVQRVLDVRQGQLCWIVGTMYVDMPLKPNILKDISKEHGLELLRTPRTYISADADIQYMLEDESGRLQLVGSMLSQNMLVTGVITAILGTENADGEFEVLDMRIADLPPQPKRWERDDEQLEEEDGMKVERPTGDGKKIALASGLDFSGTQTDSPNLSLLSEYLLGEALDEDDQDSATKIVRLIIAGNSISSEHVIDQVDGAEEVKKQIVKKYGYDAASYNPAPALYLDQFLADILPSMPVTLMAGESDPANTSLPQQPIHLAMFQTARAYATSRIGDPEDESPSWFEPVTNPWDGDVEGWRLMSTSGQPVDDILKYINTVGPYGDSPGERLEVMENMLRWRCVAPTAPDTLWSYPFQTRDPFVIEECPHVYFVGNQPRFETSVIEGPAGQEVRLITIPSFQSTGELVLLDTETLEVEVVKFEIHDEAMQTNGDSS